MNCQRRGIGVLELTGGRPGSDWCLQYHSTAGTKRLSADPWVDFASSNPVPNSEILAAL